MPRMIVPPADMKRILRERRRNGGDRYDEVWDGVYVMSPIADNDHQGIALDFAIAIRGATDGDRSIRVYPGANVSDRADDWTRNYRCPDVLVFLPGNPAEDRRTHFLGGPDFAVEILSPRDRSRKKFAFYAKVGVRELLLVDRAPWKLELYRLRDEAYELAGTSTLDRPEALASSVLPLSFRLLPGEPRPEVEATRPADGLVWTI